MSPKLLGQLVITTSQPIIPSLPQPRFSFQPTQLAMKQSSNLSIH